MSSNPAKVEAHISNEVKSALQHLQGDCESALIGLKILADLLDFPPLHSKPLAYATVHLFIAVNLPCTQTDKSAAKRHHLRQADSILRPYEFNRKHDSECQDCILMECRKNTGRGLDRLSESECVLLERLKLVAQQEVRVIRAFDRKGSPRRSQTHKRKSPYCIH